MYGGIKYGVLGWQLLKGSSLTSQHWTGRPEGRDLHAFKWTPLESSLKSWFWLLRVPDLGGDSKHVQMYTWRIFPSDVWPHYVDIREEMEMLELTQWPFWALMPLQYRCLNSMWNTPFLPNNTKSGRGPLAELPTLLYMLEFQYNACKDTNTPFLWGWDTHIKNSNCSPQNWEIDHSEVCIVQGSIIHGE